MNSRWVVAGLGKTGLSVARFLAARGAEVVAFDTRSEPPNLAAFKRELPQIEVYTDGIPANVLSTACAVIVSPGISPQYPALVRARSAGIPVFGDIELFAQHADAPYIAITGSNGKSTVTTLVAEILLADGHPVAAGANLGVPALDLLAGFKPAYYVLELSSFQLEGTQSLAPEVACILNISADHLDRHQSMTAYTAAKARIRNNARHCVLNADDPLVAGLGEGLPNVVWISSGRSNAAPYLIAERGGERWLTRNGLALCPTAWIRIKGTHNEFNALAALAITDCLGVSTHAQLEVLEKFPGLEHRCRLVAEQAGVYWFNDSKGTNIGATTAAVAGIFDRKSGVLIAGGQGKGADFTELRAALA
ncbi:MAG: UDP-N-acetylmuramoyl-L-alanine--D-glutamate ligase, partial [Gammaproteobacteria bacterium]